MKKGVVRAVRMIESEFEDGLLTVLNVFGNVLPDLSFSEIKEIFDGVFRSFIHGAEMLVIRLEGNDGFVFISSSDEFFDFLKKCYGGFEKLIDKLGGKGSRRVSKYYVLVLDEKQFKQFLRLIEKSIRDLARDFSKLDIERHVIRKINWWWEEILGEYGVKDGMLFKYNLRWIEILPDGSGDYRTLVEFLEDEFGSLVNWLRERVLSGYVVKVAGEV
jgi:hypothetical protein